MKLKILILSSAGAAVLLAAACGSSGSAAPTALWKESETAAQVIVGQKVAIYCPTGSGCVDSSAMDKISGEAITSANVIPGDEPQAWENNGYTSFVNIEVTDGTKLLCFLDWVPGKPSEDTFDSCSIGWGTPNLQVPRPLSSAGVACGP